MVKLRRLRARRVDESGSGALSALMAAGLVTLMVGCTGTGDRTITPDDRPAVDRTMSALTAPAGYRRTGTCDVPGALCFASDELLGAALASTFRTTLRQLGLVVADRDVHCDTAASQRSSQSACVAQGTEGGVTFSVVLSSRDSTNPSMPHGTEMVVTPTRIRR